MASITIHPIVYLTAEIKGRDLDSRLLIAGHLLKHGCVVVVGQQWSMISNSPTVLKGCFVFKTVNTFQARAMGKVKAHGHLIVSADEEALAYAGDACLDAVDDEAMKISDLFLADNEAHAGVLKAKFPQAHIEVVGSARVDLLALERKRAKRPIPEEYVLFNTNFPLTNGIMPLEIAAASVKDIDAEVAYEVARRKQFMELLDWTVANTKGIRVVIRPHPGERIELWKELFSADTNVLIVERSDPAPWIWGSKLLVISDSTMGLEAALMNKPCLNITPPDFLHRSKERLMERVNYSALSASEAIEPLRKFLATGDGPLSEMGDASALFPADGAANSARQIIDLVKLRGDQSPSEGLDFKWKAMGRTERQRAKFTVSQEEAGTKATWLFEEIGLRNWKMQEIDDSIFLFTP